MKFKRGFRAFLGLLLALVMLIGSTSIPAAAASWRPNFLSRLFISTALPQIDMGKWKYQKEDQVYYQTGIQYAEKSPDSDYDTLAIFVPAAYLNGTANGDGTYTCTIRNNGKTGTYTSETAPMVFPINTPGYAAQKELNGYTDVTDYTNAGFLYVHVGARGRDAGAPAGVTDFKAGIRYIRYNQGVIPGNTDAIFTFGMSGGGAQSAVLGASGDSTLYDPYLDQIGAVQGVSDAVQGSMCWCPITNLDQADEAYEWNLGSTRSGLSSEEKTISDDLAKSYAAYINRSGFVDEKGNPLTLQPSVKGIYQAGSYYDYLKREVETSLNHFLADTSFPYDASAEESGPVENPGNLAGAMNQSEKLDQIQRTQSSSTGLSLSGVYKTRQDYIDALNQNGTWVTYDAASNTAIITSIEDFVRNLKNASKNLGAFDQLDASQGENILFGYGDGKGAHFDAVLAQILKDTNSPFAKSYAKDLGKTDSAGNPVSARLEMYTPLYYLLPAEKGYQTSKVAKFWRIRTGINQGDTALSTEENLKLALQQYDGVESVDFAMVWGKGHTMAERSGTATENFIQWVNQCMK
ncbi:MAG: subtype A tannase [Acutalibacteraceae bacterium]